MLLRIRKTEKGSLALEQILFIAAIIAMAAGLYAFYGEIANYFNTVTLGDGADLPAPPAL